MIRSIVAGLVSISVFGMGIAVVVFHFTVSGFLPSAHIDTLVLSIFAITTALLLMVFRPYKVSERRPDQALLLVLVAPVTAWCAGGLFAQGPLAFALHSYHSQNAQRDEIVVSADNIGRKCRNRVVLSDSTFLHPRALCDLSLPEIDVLKNGGRLKIEGSISKYGFHVEGHCCARKSS